MTAAEAVVGARYRVAGGRVIHVVGRVQERRFFSLCKSVAATQLRGPFSGTYPGAHIADPAHLARWSMCAECERRAEVTP